MASKIQNEQVGNVRVTFELYENGSVSVHSVVTHGNFVETYNGSLTFESISEMERWVNSRYNK